MNDAHIKLTKEKFPTLFSFAQEYTDNDATDIRQHFRDKALLLFGEDYWLKYETALQVLAQEDRLFLLNRLRTVTKKLSEEKGWPHFEEILNEALVYQFLSNEGHERVCFIKTDRKRLTPDLKIHDREGSIKGLAEVKTTRFSDDEYKIVSEEFKTGKWRFLDTSVHPTLYKKITSGIEEAIKQLWKYDSSALSIRRIYLFLNLDIGNLLDIIFTPDSDLQEFLYRLKETIKKDVKSTELKIYVLSGRSPVELCK